MKVVYRVTEEAARTNGFDMDEIETAIEKLDAVSKEFPVDFSYDRNIDEETI